MAVLGVILLNGTTADANEVMSNFYPLYNDMAPVNVAVANKTGTGRFVLDTGATLVNPILTTPTFTGIVPQLPPIGSIIPFYDFNALVTFNTTYWKYCNGTTIVSVGSPLNGQTAPDLSGRALVGFGTDGGGNIGTATWATAAVGNAGNTINIAHAHTVAGHTHDLSNHTHTGPSHTHTFADGGHTHASGTLQFQVGQVDVSQNLFGYDAAGTQIYWSTVETVSSGTGAIVADNWNAAPVTYYTSNGTGATGSTAVSGTTGASGTGATGAPNTNTSGTTSPATDSQLSATQSIQPISIRVRFIMRVL